MKKTFRLVGLDCAHCAAKMENAIQKLPSVKQASINFMTTKMIIEAEDADMDTTMQEIEGIIKKLEPDVVVKRG